MEDKQYSILQYEAIIQMLQTRHKISEDPKMAFEQGQAVGEMLKILTDSADLHSLLDSVKAYTEYDGTKVDKTKTVLTRLIKLEQRVLEKFGPDNDYAKDITRIRSSYKEVGMSKNDIIILNKINKHLNNLA